MADWKRQVPEYFRSLTSIGNHPIGIPHDCVMSRWGYDRIGFSNWGATNAYRHATHEEVEAAKANAGTAQTEAEQFAALDRKASKNAADAAGCNGVESQIAKQFAAAMDEWRQLETDYVNSLVSLSTVTPQSLPAYSFYQDGLQVGLDLGEHHLRSLLEPLKLACVRAAGVDFTPIQKFLASMATRPILRYGEHPKQNGDWEAAKHQAELLPIYLAAHERAEAEKKDAERFVPKLKKELKSTGAIKAAGWIWGGILFAAGWMASHVWAWLKAQL